MARIGALFLAMANYLTRVLVIIGVLFVAVLILAYYSIHKMNRTSRGDYFSAGEKEFTSRLKGVLNLNKDAILQDLLAGEWRLICLYGQYAEPTQQTEILTGIKGITFENNDDMDIWSLDNIWSINFVGDKRNVTMKQSMAWPGGIYYEGDGRVCYCAASARLRPTRLSGNTLDVQGVGVEAQGGTCDG